MSHTPTKGIPPYWNAAKQHLAAVDPIMARVIQHHEEPPLRSSGKPFETLVHSIVGQQISAKAAAAVWGRFVDLVQEVTPPMILAHTPEALRAVGLSGRKVEYIRGLASDAPWVCHHDWASESDEQVRKNCARYAALAPGPQRWC